MLFDDLRPEKGPFLQAESANVWRVVDIYGKGNTGPFAESTFVLCDVYSRVRPSGQRTGMPILYYRADPSGSLHDVGNPDNPQNIYHYQDNHALVTLGVPRPARRGAPACRPQTGLPEHAGSQQFLTAPSLTGGDTFILIIAGAVAATARRTTSATSSGSTVNADTVRGIAKAFG